MKVYPGFVEVSFAAVVSAAIMSACEAVRTPIDDDYEFGDTTQDLRTQAVVLRARYCAAVGDSAARAAAGDLLRNKGIPIPDDGVCNKALGELDPSSSEE